MAQRTSPKFRPNKLHTVYLDGAMPNHPIDGRHYTLTHSDRTGDLYLSIGPEYHLDQVSGWYTKRMRDEVLAEWCVATPGELAPTERELNRKNAVHKQAHILHVYVHVRGSKALGRARRRNRALMRELPFAFSAIRYGDTYLMDTHPELDESPIYVHFTAHVEKYSRVEEWGQLKDYAPVRTSHRRR